MKLAKPLKKREKKQVISVFGGSSGGPPGPSGSAQKDENCKMPSKP